MKGNLLSIIFLLSIISFQNLIGQVQPAVIQKVSYDLTNENQINISWIQENSSYTILGFKIYLWKTVNEEVADINDPNVDSYDYLIQPDDPSPYIFTISTIYLDVNGDVKPTLISDEFFLVIEIEEVDYHQCETTNILHFNEYMIDQTVPVYRFYTSINNSNWVLLEEISTEELEIVRTETIQGPGFPFSSYIYEFKHEGIVPDNNYKYYVEAIFPNGLFPDANSHSSEVFSPSYPMPQPPSIQSVSVQQNGSILITADVLDTQLCQSVYYNRYINPGETPVIIQENLPAAGTSVSTSDNEVESDANSYFYEIAVTDQCGFPISASEVHRSILLEGKIDSQNTVTLNWNSYEGWIVTGQELYRSFNGMETLLATPTAFTETYQDNTIGPLAAAGGVLSYYVKAINEDGSGRYSNSNLVSFTFDVEPYLPNAFNPNSTEAINSRFKPVQSYLNASGYQLQVYHRWGGLIWETNDPNEGWDGRNKNGKLLQRGTYAYLLLYQNAAGIGQQKRGTVTLLY